MQVRERATISVEEAGRLVGIGRALAYEAAGRGELGGAIRIGRRLIVPVAPLAAQLGLTVSEALARLEEGE